MSKVDGGGSLIDVAAMTIDSAVIAVALAAL